LVVAFLQIPAKDVLLICLSLLCGQGASCETITSSWYAWQTLVAQPAAYRCVPIDLRITLPARDGIFYLILITRCKTLLL
jgi:hypothetical protein